MSKYIDADLYVEMQIYDDEHEEWTWWKGTIEDLLDQWTEEGCPPTIEVSEDCISREWVKGICEFMLDEEMLGHMLGHIEDAPSVIPKRAEGEWVYCEDDEGKDGYRCSECGFFVPWYYGYEDINYIYKYHACPSCMARMKGADDVLEGNR